MKRVATDISESSLVQLSPSKPQTIKELQIKHQLDYKSLTKHWYCNVSQIRLTPFFQEFWPNILDCCKTRSTLNNYKNTLINNYSFLGLVAIAHKKAFPRKDVYDPQDRASYADKKEFLNQLLDLGFTPTQEDKEIAFFEKWKEYFPKVIQETHRIRYINPAFELDTDIPQEIKDYIAILTFHVKFNAEKSLF